jgi:hypothetical protein
MSITPADVLAAIDVLVQAQNESDDMPFETAIALREAVEELKRRSNETIGLLTMEMLRQVEAAAKTVDGVTYIAVNDSKDTWDHDQIEARVVATARLAALDKTTGEIDPAEAARQAAWLMRKIYVSPSTTAKVGALGELELDADDVRTRKTKGRKLHEVDSAR